jgi:tripartite-type tricarboxylate transporter receptor subunit TctC
VRIKAVQLRNAYRGTGLYSWSVIWTVTNNRIIVPFAAGGPSDTAARVAAQTLTHHIKQNVPAP